MYIKVSIPDNSESNLQNILQVPAMSIIILKLITYLGYCTLSSQKICHHIFQINTMVIIWTINIPDHYIPDP